jgi:serine/threonine protein kinase
VFFKQRKKLIFLNRVQLALWHGKSAVAVKYLCHSDVKSVAELVQEVSVLERVRHPHVVSCYGMALDPQRGLMVVTEFMAGTSFALLLKKSQKLTVKFCCACVKVGRCSSTCGPTFCRWSPKCW